MQKGKKFLWQYYPFYLLIILLSLIAISWYATGAIRRLYLDRTAADLEARSRLVGILFTDDLARKDRERIQSQCQTLGQELAIRFTVVLPSGTVIGDSGELPENMENHADRPEIHDALAGKVGQTVRFSTTLKQDMMYVAVPVTNHDDIIAVVRSSLSVAVLSKTLTALYHRMIIAGFVIAMSAAVVSIILSRRLKKPVEELKEGALRFGQGDLTHRLHISDPEEFMILGDSLNHMAAELNKRIHTITSQRNELESILSSMTEAVLVVDTEEKIIRCNLAASHLFGVNPENTKNKSIQEIIRNIQLLKFIRETLSSQDTGEREITLHEEEDRFLQAHGTVLLDYDKQIIGVLVVLNDITRIKRLENIRKDFVANVSHELKTPITAIKASVETLKDGAVGKARDAGRFLDIITNHAERLNAIIEDLLNLSRIEQEAEKRQIILSKSNIREVLQEAISVCQNKASERKIHIELECDQTLSGRINPPLLEEAVINLIDNAIKYSKVGSRVRIEGFQENDEVVIRIQDWGTGIPQEYLPRIFERFYRVDKARNRNLGGTGLGLAIVKHILNAHNGRVSVKSTPRKGSIFSLYLPRL